jgi:hypothetical protein
MSSPTDDVMDFMMAVALKNKFLQPYKDGSNSTRTKYKINFEKTSSFIIKEFQSGNFGKVMFDDDCLT